MLVSIDAKIAFDVIQYQILNKAMNEKESTQTQKKTKYTSKHTRKKRENLINDIYQTQELNF